MRDSSTVPLCRSSDAAVRGLSRGDPPTISAYHVVLTTVLGLGLVAWQHAAFRSGGSFAGHLTIIAIDALLAVPVAAAAVWTATVLIGRGDGPWHLVTRAVAVSVGFATLCVPLAVL